MGASPDVPLGVAAFYMRGAENCKWLGAADGRGAEPGGKLLVCRPTARIPRVRFEMRKFERNDVDVELVIAILGVAMVCGVVLLRVVPGEFLPTAPCTFHRLTGQPCLTCGGTRAARALGHFRVLEALRWNPLVAVWLMAAVPHALWVFASRWFGLRRPRVIPQNRGERWALWSGLLLLIAGNWLYLCLSGV